MASRRLVMVGRRQRRPSVVIMSQRWDPGYAERRCRLLPWPAVTGIVLATPAAKPSAGCLPSGWGLTTSDRGLGVELGDSPNETSQVAPQQGLCHVQRSSQLQSSVLRHHWTQLKAILVGCETGASQR